LKATRIVGFQETEEFINKLDKEAESKGLSRSDYIREALREKIEKLHAHVEQLKSLENSQETK